MKNLIIKTITTVIAVVYVGAFNTCEPQIGIGMVEIAMSAYVLVVIPCVVYTLYMLSDWSKK